MPVKTPLRLTIEYRPTAEIKPDPKNPRRHSPRQIAQIAASMGEFGNNCPILIDAKTQVIAGHGRLEAARLRGDVTVPTICLGHLTPAQCRAYLLADNRLAELSAWDQEGLALLIQELDGLDLAFNVELTGFEGARLEQLLGIESAPGIDPKADQIPEIEAFAVTRRGDVWDMGSHRLVCGDARDSVSYIALMAGEAARMVLTDPPFNVPIDGHVGGKGKVARRPFVMASGEMSRPEFTRFLQGALTHCASFSLDGSLHYIFMDWRHMDELLAAGAAVYAELKNLVVWTKENAGMGAFYRSQHELVFVFKKGSASHLNNFGMGETGRYRTNVWSYPGLNSFGPGRDEALAMHPTVKPTSLLGDAILDVSRRGDIVLDPFAGSGATLIAAEKTKRRARLIELDPLYCDTICRRWEAFANAPARLVGSGQSFEDVAAERAGEKKADADEAP